ncbi:fungal-specific transcription factor domain-containing protein [Thelonectria olida]|uniref:Fungal-specific transcription factor domain-containing protein n=1 Tax=Thelonectria olida TaxID=1576542 RepID=A0A9P8VRN0_9HYPO|nr:fungal-specific transcription factor domain-containing protein [Thelonectria olida]
MEKPIKRPNIGKRKACDLCHIRKIKCDSKEPKCTHCTFYNKECTYTPVNRKKKKKTQKQKSGSSTDPTSVQAEATLKEYESLSNLFLQVHGHGTIIESGIFTDSLLPASQTEAYTLPPFEVIFPILDEYFINFNSFVPLFEQESFMASARDWYSSSAHRDAATWATINIALALSLQQCGYDSEPTRSEDLQIYVGNAQSVMNSLATRDADLKGLQVILGLVIIFQGVLDPRPAAVLTATAVKLAHRMKLNSKQGHKGISEAAVEERRRVFWITYILDRDTSVRAREPYLHRDEDIGIDMPDQSTDIETCSSGDDARSSRFLCQRASLARIQGKVYDFTFSVQARDLQPTESTLNDAIIDAMLQEWREQLPVEYSGERVFDNSYPEKLRRHLLTLHFSYFQLAFRNHLLYGHGMDWIGNLVNYSSQYSLEGDDQADKDGPQVLQLPPNWHEKVTMAKLCMAMFRLVGSTDSALNWYLACTYLSALTILIAAKLIGTEHGAEGGTVPDEQEQLINEGLRFIHHMATTRDARLEKVHAACAELNRRADVAKVTTLGTMSELLDAPWLPAFRHIGDTGAEGPPSVPSSKVLHVLTEICYKE